MKRVLVLCPSAWDEQALASPASAGYEIIYAARELYDDAALLEDPHFDVHAHLERLIDTNRDAGLHGVIGTGDYPGSLLAPVVAGALGLPSPSLASVLRLTHKYASRELQARVVPEATPHFVAIDPDRPINTLPYPLFVKPVKGMMSIGARCVNDDAELDAAVHFSVGQGASPRDRWGVLQKLIDGASPHPVPVHWFIGESPLRGVQVTVDGFVEQGRAVIMGIVDSIMYSGTMSFERFDYPSHLPLEVQRRMESIAVRCIEGSGFDQSCFNIEMFYDASSAEIHIIEVNPRMSYQFADLYHRVDGTHTHSIQLALATGTPAPWQRGRGEDGVAASFVMRTFEDRRVAHAPSDEEITAIVSRFPGTIVKPMCRTGDRLSQHDQDVGSFRYCIVNMSAADVETLQHQFRQVRESLRFVFADL